MSLRMENLVRLSTMCTVRLTMGQPYKYSILRSSNLKRIRASRKAYSFNMRNANPIFDCWPTEG